MKFNCERESLTEAIGSAGRAVSTRSALPVLSNFLVKASGESVEFVGSDLDLTIRVSTAAQSVVDGTAVLPARLFGDIVRSLEPGAVSVKIEDDEAQIRSGRSEFSLRVPPNEFPALPDMDSSGIRMDALALADALRQVISAASRDDARPILTGVLMVSEGSGLRLVATDSYRLAVRDLPGESRAAQALADRPDGGHFLVPAKALAELQRLLPAGEETVELSFNDRHVCFDTGRATLTARLIEGTFPNYQQLIPGGYPNRLIVAREACIEAVKRVRLIGQGRDNNPIRLQMNSNGLELTTIVHDVGEASEMLDDAKYEGSETTVAFNPEFLLDGLQAISTDEVSVDTQDTSKPAIVKAVDPLAGEFLYLLMPVRVTP